MPDAEHLSVEPRQTAAQRHIELRQRGLADLLRIEPFRHQHRRHAVRIPGRVRAVELRPVIARPMLHAAPHGLGQPVMPAQHIVKAFHVMDQPHRFLQTIEEAGRHRADEALVRPRQHRRPIEIGLRQLGGFMDLHRLVRHPGERQPGWQHQPLLGPANRAIDAPLVKAEIDRAERGNRIRQQQRRMPCRIDRGPDRGQRQGHAGRSFVVHGAHRFDRMPRIGRQSGLHRGGIGAHPPIRRNRLDLDAQGRSHPAPGFREIAGLDDQDLVALAEQVDQARFPRRMARTGVEEQMLLRPQHPFHPVDTAVVERDEIGIHEIYRMVRLRMQDAVRDIGRPGIGEEQPAARFLGHRRIAPVAPAPMPVRVAS